MSEQSESEVEHTLFIVERDDLDDTVPYQVMKAEHARDSEQAKALEGVMCQLVEAAEAETGEPHRLVIEADTPEVTHRHYEMHEERIEGEQLVTDGGVDQSEAEDDQPDTSGEQIPTLDDVMDMELEDHDEQKWVVLYDEDYDDLLIDAGDSVALLVDNNQACELLKLTSQVVADLAPEYAPDKEPIQAMIDELQEVQNDAE